MVTTYTATNLTEFIQAVENASNTSGTKLWYRGISNNSTHRLSPGLYRHTGGLAFDELHKLEKRIISEFRYQSPPFSDRIPTDDLELLFLMQHFGVPTRLLDWTENPLVALFFAVVHGYGGAPDDEDAAVWALNPISMNEFALKHVSHKGGALQINDSSARGYRPESEDINAQPIAIYGVHNSPRIVSQRGVFVIFGSNLSPLDENAELEAASALSKIEIPKGSRGALRSSLTSIGLTDSTVFPDLDGLAREIRRRHGF
jgi:hypothetical protein